ncbi:MAG: hypothetical protein NTY32_00425, partial [Bacteroidia bacterium]|nr:hypothetical protein [Bacteroidia bacterium]
VGWNDKTKLPPTDQNVSLEEVNDAITKLRSLCFNVSLSASEIQTHENGSDFFIIKIFNSQKSIATTSDGKIYIRVADKCEPIRCEDIHRMANEKQTYQWELVCPKTVMLSDIAPNSLSGFAKEIRNSDRVKDHIKQMEDVEMAESYNLVDGQYLTYLGILWLGNAKQRSRISYPITVQYIVYDALERKVRKEDWHDNTLNPEQLLLDIEKKAIELKYYHEFPDGLFRKQIRHYHPKVIREILLNAFAHKSFTISGDIMIEVYPDRLEISNPGGLPLGVTKDNILHARQRRNPQLIRIMHDLKLMEGEGSGYDLIYELNAMDSKQNPEIISDFNHTKVVQSAAITDIEILPLLDYVVHNYQLSQKDFIAFGLVAQHKKLLSTQLTSLLQLAEEDRLRSYTAGLLRQEILIKRGVKKSNEFLINPKLIANSKVNMKTTLKTIEPYRLLALLEEDVRMHPGCSLKSIVQRLPDVDEKDIRKCVYAFVKEGFFEASGGNRNKTYKKTKKK